MTGNFECEFNQQSEGMDTNDSYGGEKASSRKSNSSSPKNKSSRGSRPKRRGTGLPKGAQEGAKTALDVLTVLAGSTNFEDDLRRHDGVWVDNSILGQATFQLQLPADPRGPGEVQVLMLGAYPASMNISGGRTESFVAGMLRRHVQWLDIFPLSANRPSSKINYTGLFKGGEMVRKGNYLSPFSRIAHFWCSIVRTLVYI